MLDEVGIDRNDLCKDCKDYRIKLRANLLRLYITATVEMDDVLRESIMNKIRNICEGMKYMMKIKEE